LIAALHFFPIILSSHYFVTLPTRDSATGAEYAPLETYTTRAINAA
jgi:hypothetical protein